MDFLLIQMDGCIISITPLFLRLIAAALVKCAVAAALVAVLSARVAAATNVAVLRAVGVEVLEFQEAWPLINLEILINFKSLCVQ
jgi:hypothetical protein